MHINLRACAPTVLALNVWLVDASHVRANASHSPRPLCMAVLACREPQLACVRQGHVCLEATRSTSTISSADGGCIPAAGSDVVSVWWDA